MYTKFMRGSPLLMGDNRTPGLRLPADLEVLIPQIIKVCEGFGLDFYPIVVQKLTYDEISEVASYGGFPVRYPHWKWGMEYEELQRGYEHGMHKIYEMVINTNPCYIYCLDSNTLVDDVTVVGHAIGHNDFFKNNVFFRHTADNMMNQLANDASRIRRYISRWGKEKVTEFIDWILRLETLVDPANAWRTRKIKDPVVQDERIYHHPRRLDVKENHEYMDRYLNPVEWKLEQDEKAEREEVAEEIGISKKEKTRDILGFLRDHAPLKPWQADILAMLYNETQYFMPQRATHMMNEGWASFVDFNIMAREGFVELGQPEVEKIDPITGKKVMVKQCGVVEFSQHKAGVLGGKYSLNPYKLGFCLFLDIEERWNKGCFGQEWEDCKDMKTREEWDKKLGLGHEKVLEVRRFYNDYQMISEFFTAEFCNRYEFFEWKKRPNGEIVLVDRDPASIRRKLMGRYLNGGLPDIRLEDSNYRGKGELLIQHYHDGRVLYRSYIDPVLQGLCKIWARPVHLATCNKDGEEIVYSCHDAEQISKPISRDEFESRGSPGSSSSSSSS